MRCHRGHPGASNGTNDRASGSLPAFNPGGSAHIADRHTTLLATLIVRGTLHFQHLAGGTGAVIDENGRIRIHHQRLKGEKFLCEARLGDDRQEQPQDEYTHNNYLT